MYRLDGLIRFLDHRSVWQLVAGYAIAAWVVLQVTDTLASLIGLPLWFGMAVLGLLAAGFVVVLMTGLLHGRLGAGGGSPAGGRLDRAFTWRHAAEAGFVGFALLGLGTTGYMAARAFGIGPAGTLLARGVLSADGELVLADFEAALVRIGHNHDRLGRADSAFAYDGRYLSTPSRLRYATDPEWRARVLERLGQLHEARGDTASAAANYARFIELWSGADPSLGPAVEAARTRLATLVARG